MYIYFDIEKAAREAALDPEALKRLEEEVRQEFPADELMFELHLLRAVKSTKPQP